MKKIKQLLFSVCDVSNSLLTILSSRCVFMVLRRHLLINAVKETMEKKCFTFNEQTIASPAWF